MVVIITGSSTGFNRKGTALQNIMQYAAQHRTEEKGHIQNATSIPFVKQSRVLESRRKEGRIEKVSETSLSMFILFIGSFPNV